MSGRAAPYAPLLSIGGLSERYARGETPGKVLHEVMERVRGYPDKAVWITLLNEGQIAGQITALEVKKKAGAPLPLYGIPFAVKDNIDVGGLPTTAACPAFSHLPEHSATVVRKLCDAGAIVVGKTNLDQFATGLVGVRSPYGACENVFDRSYVSGGSSSGSAIAVAAGLVCFALGTDTAGSGRVPAAFNNIVGLKPTVGRLSVSGVVPACRTLDCVSIFAGNCADAQQVLAVAEGFDAADAYSRTAPPESGGKPKGFRCGIPTAETLEFFGNHEAQTLFAAATERVRAIGGTPVAFDFKPFLAVAKLLYEGPWVAERLVATREIFERQPEALVPVLRNILTGATKVTGVAAFEGMYKLQALRRVAEAEWTKMDVMLIPTTGTIYKIAEVLAEPIKLNSNLGYYTNFVNLLDLCGIAVPNGFQSNGLPVGVTFIAPAWADGFVSKIGAAYHDRVLEEGVA